MDPETQTDPPTCAKDVMTANVITARPGSSVAEIGRLLLDHGISAVPVVSDDGVPIGMVSEGDLLRRPPPERLARRDWWLAVVTGAQPLDDNFLAQVKAAGRTAREIMTAPLVTVSETTGLGEIARLHGIGGAPGIGATEARTIRTERRQFPTACRGLPQRRGSTSRRSPA